MDYNSIVGRIAATADQQYARNYKEVKDVMQDIRSELEAHDSNASEDPTNYAYAGDLSYVLGELKNVLDFIMSANRNKR